MIPRYAIGAKEHYRGGEFWCADITAEPHVEGDWARWCDVATTLEHARAQVAERDQQIQDERNTARLHWDAFVQSQAALRASERQRTALVDAVEYIRTYLSELELPSICQKRLAGVLRRLDQALTPPAGKD